MSFSSVGLLGEFASKDSKYLLALLDDSLHVLALLPNQAFGHHEVPVLNLNVVAAGELLALIAAFGMLFPAEVGVLFFFVLGKLADLRAGFAEAFAFLVVFLEAFGVRVLGYEG